MTDPGTEPRSRRTAHDAGPLNYGGGRALPVQVGLDDEQGNLDSGLLLRMHRALLGMTDGQILRIASPSADLTEQLRAFEAASRHAILSVVPDPDRPGWSFHFLRKGLARTDWAPRGAGMALPAGDTQSIDSLMPTRVWLYTNYDCAISRATTAAWWPARGLTRVAYPTSGSARWSIKRWSMGWTRSS
jgi:hypothetical protein